MRIYFSPDQTPVLLDSLMAMESLHRRLDSFLDSGEDSIRLQAEQWGDPDPYEEFLGGLEIRKSEGPLTLGLTANRWLELKGALRNLKRYVSHFRFEQDNCHHHPGDVNLEGYIQPGSMDLIIEVCSDWIHDLKVMQH
jgi:hypothetical protein